MVKKLNENGKFAKFTNLNKTCPKDYYYCLELTRWWITWLGIKCWVFLDTIKFAMRLFGYNDVNLRGLNYNGDEATIE